MSPASRSYVNGIFAVFYLKKGSVLYLTQTIWYAKMANVCAFLMAFFASAVYLDELTNCFKSEACSNSPWMLVMRDEKRIAPGFETEILYFTTQFQNQAKRTKMVNQQMFQSGAFIIAAVCICSKKSKPLENNSRNILSEVTCILYNPVL